MRNTGTVLLSVTLTVMICGTVFLRKTAAQAPVTPGPADGNRHLRQLPFASGSITSIDPTADTIVIQPQFGRTSQTVQLSSKTTIVAKIVATVADLHVNDHIQIQGVPTGITAASVQAGKIPDFLSGAGPILPGAAPGAPDAARPVENAGSAFASAEGTVTATDPLMVSLGPDISIVIKLTPDTQVMKITPVALTDLKAGDKIMAIGQSNNEGIFVATGIAVNLSAGMGTGIGHFSAYPNRPTSVPPPPVSSLPSPGALNR